VIGISPIRSILFIFFNFDFGFDTLSSTFYDFQTYSFFLQNFHMWDFLVIILLKIL